MNENQLITTANIQEIAERGAKIYEKIKTCYEPHKTGSFLAIEVDSEEAYLGSTSAKALASAKQSHPDKVFYVVKVGYDVAETVAKAFIDANA